MQNTVATFVAVASFATRFLISEIQALLMVSIWEDKYRNCSK